MVKKSTFSVYKVYLFIAFATALGQHTIWTIMAVYQVEVAKLNPLQLVLVGTVLELGCFLLQVPTGALADLYSRRLSVIIGYLLMGISYLLQAFVPRFEAILIAQVLLAAGFAFGCYCFSYILSSAFR
ncbi:MAG: MFS transporter [Ktedonobacteraceae bacterium]|nr:MFS transporter [Ktedonobacteraceae bacterium]